MKKESLLHRKSSTILKNGKQLVGENNLRSNEATFPFESQLFLIGHASTVPYLEYGFMRKKAISVSDLCGRLIRKVLSFNAQFLESAKFPHTRARYFISIYVLKLLIHYFPIDCH